ncbi:hypothetical protein GOP47_0021473 [Adiantum capillus-veneris]|uniref:Ribosome-binding factor A n=1 Tax=Adiantum capillus-veneris TaxID=13818 RepID=A0A9D4U9N4_ADICA|nr:hypothetical protein GOP47_0021473 [Adiantum capillus-veneris]
MQLPAALDFSQRLTFCKHAWLSHVTAHRGHGSSRIVCMAHPRRVKMVAQQIKREIGDMLIKDKVLQHAILPETALGADMYLTSLATVSDVVLSNDLQVAKVYVSICSDERGKEIVMEGLKAKTKHVRAGLGKRMQLRLTPEVRFIMDDSLERASRVLAILDRLKTEREQREAGNGSVDDSDDDDNWEDIEEDGKPLATASKEINQDGLYKDRLFVIPVHMPAWCFGN